MKKIIFVLIFLLLIGGVYGGNNTSSIDNPTMYISDGEMIESLESGDSNISFEDGYKGYCAEWGEHSAEENQSFYVESTSSLNNSNYLKTMFLFFYNQTQKDVYATQHMIWKFTDNKQFSRFNQTWYNQIITTGDKYTIPDEGKIILNDTHQFSFDFKLFVPLINEFQNFFAYQFLIEEIQYNSTIDVNNTINNTNSTIQLPIYNESYNNSIDDISIEKIDEKDDSNNASIIVDKETGANLWILGCVIILVLIILVLNKRE